MQLTLTIENVARLPDGGPLSYTVTGRRGFDIGRAQYLDWTLPDPDRHISGKHCEIRHQDGDYLLYDVSTNGTFVNGSQNRVQSPYRLKDGDRLTIGQYIIAAKVEKSAEAQPLTSGFIHNTAGYDDLWRPEGESPAPISPKDTRPPAASPIVQGDWLDRPADIPAPPHSAQDLHEQWIAPPVALEPPPEPPPAPTPRRPAAPVSDEPWIKAQPDAAPTPAPREQSERRVEASPTPRVEPSGAPDFQTFLSAFSVASGAPLGPLSQRAPEELGQELGALMRRLALDMKHLLDARSETKRMTRSAQQTMVQLEGNNPLKFSPSVDDAMRLLFGPPTRSYLDAEQAFAQAFSDLKQHQVKTFAAMREAMRAIAEELDPENIDKSTDARGGLFKSARKARLWELYQTRWKSMTCRQDDGLVGAFMRHFSDSYDKN
jgi:type VI secretion system protein ImpI